MCMKNNKGLFLPLLSLCHKICKRHIILFSRDAWKTWLWNQQVLSHDRHWSTLLFQALFDIQTMLLSGLWAYLESLTLQGAHHTLHLTLMSVSMFKCHSLYFIYLQHYVYAFIVIWLCYNNLFNIVTCFFIVALYVSSIPLNIQVLLHRGRQGRTFQQPISLSPLSIYHFKVGIQYLYIRFVFWKTCDTIFSLLIFIQFSLQISAQLRFYLTPAMTWHCLQVNSGILLICSCTAFQLYPHFPLHLRGWAGLYYVSPHTKKLPFSSRPSIHLKLWWPTHPYFLSVWKMGDDKSAEAILSFFIIYFHNTCSLLIIYRTGSYYYIYFLINKR